MTQRLIKEKDNVFDQFVKKFARSNRMSTFQSRKY